MRLKQLIGIIVCSCTLTGCVVAYPPLEDQAEATLQLDWQDMSLAQSSLPYSLPESVVSPPPPPAVEEKKAMLPVELQQDPLLAHIATMRSVVNPQRYEDGVYGKVNGAVFYSTTTDRIQDWDHLYWVMVRVLSEKYGCFMRQKFKKEHLTAFGCRDGRTVVFHRARGRHWIQFLARQYDRKGAEIILAPGEGGRRPTSKRGVISQR